MILHQTAVYKSPLALGTKDKPIYIDCDPNHATETPQLAVRTSTFTLPQRPCPPPVFNSTLKLNPRSRSRAKGKASSFATSPMCAESLVAEPMIANSQAIVQSLKRKHIDVEDDADLEMSKKLKKSEKKRRKRERRAARIAQLGDQMDSRHDPDVHSNLNKAPDHSDWSLAPPQWKAPIDTFWTNGSSSSNLTKPFTAMSSYETHSQQIEEFEMIVSQESESVSERTLNHIPPPSYSELAVSTTPTSGRRSASLKMSPLVEQGAPSRLLIRSLSKITYMPQFQIPLWR
ncbi:hypothetical protein K439DRAFT_1627024 [Ramaria rubella]|nr:hypothetical protein K439DRAFT_1627024 [Ramaria rubella]